MSNYQIIHIPTSQTHLKLPLPLILAESYTDQYPSTCLNSSAGDDYPIVHVLWVVEFGYLTERSQTLRLQFCVLDGADAYIPLSSGIPMIKNILGAHCFTILHKVDR
jgi:hypothetical protein